MPDSNPDCAGLHADHLAYVIYTSGSTGTPKGAMNAHVGVVNRLLWMQDSYRLTCDDVVLQKTPFSFDVSVWEFFWPLLTGARLVMARPGGQKDPAYLCDVVQQQKVTTLHFVPSMLQAFLEYEGASSCRSVKRVICSGEALPAALVRRFLARFPACELHNLYGPTEAAVDVSAWKCTGTEAANVPIGRPIANTRIYILGSRGEPVPVGVAGEIFIGGVQVGRGYLNRPDLTAERFVADPFSADPGARMYKTGDLGRWSADGVIEYLGRNDFQVKIRGFRIELGEIEARLAEHVGVREPVVIAHESTDGDKRLVAYYVSGGHIASDVLRAHLREKLPEYMVPAAYVRLGRMPLSPNGKLDRKALPAPDNGVFVQDTYEAPAGPVEERLARIWATLLGLERVGRNASFFDLGGHSLLAVRMLVLIEAEFGRSLNLTALFKTPTIASLSPLLQQADSPDISSPHAVPIQPHGTKRPLFSIVTPTAYLNIARNLGNDQPVIGLQLFDPAKPLERQYSRFEDMAAECVRLIREIQPQGPYAVIGWCAAGVLAFETAQQLIQMGHEVSFVGIIDGWAPDYVRRRGQLWLKTTDLASRCKRALAQRRAGQLSVKSLVAKVFAPMMTRSGSGGGAPPAEGTAGPADPQLNAMVQSDLQMWAYLWRLQCAYEPKVLPGRAHVFVAEDRPTGWLADASLGWARLATQGCEVVPYEGRHESIFEEPGASQAAAVIAAGLQARPARTPARAFSGSIAARPNGLSTSPSDSLVSIVIPAYNAEKDVARAIRCAMSQTYLAIEIIVVDDGSQDGTVQAAREMLKSRFRGRWSVLELGFNRGVSAARNAGVKQAQGEWIQFLDSDDAIATDKIEAQMKYARAAGPDVAAIYSSWRHVYLEEGGYVPAGPVSTPRYEGKHPLMFAMYFAPLHHGACLIRRSALERVQGFNESMRSYEDADLLVRIAKEVGRFQFVASNSPSYLWRLYKEQAREGGEDARYKLQGTAMNWMRVVKEAAEDQRISDILPSSEDRVVWRQHCKSYAQRLLESDPGAFRLFMGELRSVDPDFTYP
jgi:amino acid adenylation domain-containing protein